MKCNHVPILISIATIILVCSGFFGILTMMMGDWRCHLGCFLIIDMEVYISVNVCNLLKSEFDLFIIRLRSDRTYRLIRDYSVFQSRLHNLCICVVAPVHQT